MRTSAPSMIAHHPVIVRTNNCLKRLFGAPPQKPYVQEIVQQILAALYAVEHGLSRLKTTHSWPPLALWVRC